MDYEQAPATWALSEQGVADSRTRAGELRVLGLSELVSSEEPKALATAREIADGLGIGWRTAPGLHEHERDPFPYLEDAAWQALIRRLFDSPDELVMGRETANQALARFGEAVDDVLSSSPTGSIGIVTHGTVMALYAAKVKGEDPYPIWASLNLPDYVVLVV
jgi:broad specificity phosphatase PhoE